MNAPYSAPESMNDLFGTNLLNAAAAEGPSRIFCRSWSAAQLRAAAEADRNAQRYGAHMSARIALAGSAHLVDPAPIRSMVAACMGGVAGTYYIVAALHLAQLAILLPHLLTDTQYRLLLSPLEAAENAAEPVSSAMLLAA
jgi:hypothetical protein